MKNIPLERPVFPKRAVITGGMPYGNKALHFGHVGGYFVHADVFARFLRDRIGSENVIFVSGTDCYGAAIWASYQQLVETEHFEGSLYDYVRNHYEDQKKTLSEYFIAPNLYAASALDAPGKVHEAVSAQIFESLYEKGLLFKSSSPQFYDPEFDTWLNGRQVVGKCPIEGCSSDKAYADECALGHQYMPSDLLHPKSTLSGKTPVLKEVENWYFDLEKYQRLLQEFVTYLREHTCARPYLLNTLEEFLKPPVIYVQRKLLAGKEDLFSQLPAHEVIDEPKKPSLTLVFENLALRDEARAILDRENIRFRTGKTLVPFRLSGNVPWGISVPEKEGLKDLTFWVWPESLWAPISFVQAYLAQVGKDPADWKLWWEDLDSQIYQFIGEDNIYFYGIAEMGMFLALMNIMPEDKVDFNKIRLPHLIPNNHLLFMDKKASSSSDLKPPMAHELLDYYTAEQLRMHFLSLGLAKKSVSFCPQALLPEAMREKNDPVLKDGNLLSNVLNRLARSCFYTAQEYFDGILPRGPISEEVLRFSEEAILTYENHMYRHEFHSVTYVLDDYIRQMNKIWARDMKEAEAKEDKKAKEQTLIHGFHALRVAISLLHPMVPESCEGVRNYLKIDERIWSWDYIFEPLSFFTKEGHVLKELPPKTDFFEKHPSQFR